MKIKLNEFRVQPDEKVKLRDCPTIIDPFFKSKKHYKKLLKKHVGELSKLQRLHYASGRYAILLIFQGMDAAGKDGVIRHVMSGINPQSCQVYSFKQPSSPHFQTHHKWYLP